MSAVQLVVGIRSRVHGGPAKLMGVSTDGSNKGSPIEHFKMFQNIATFSDGCRCHAETRSSAC